jgi:hypothetical protein
MQGELGLRDAEAELAQQALHRPGQTLPRLDHFCCADSWCVLLRLHTFVVLQTAGGVCSGCLPAVWARG